MNPLARVMMKNVHGVPQKKSQTPVYSALGHEAHHGHEHKSGMASFVSTGHWYGERGQHIFGLFGRLLGEIV